MEAFAPAGVEIALRGEGLGAEIVEERVESEGPAGFRVHMRVIACGGSAHWRPGQRIFHELVAQDRKVF